MHRLTDGFRLGGRYLLRARIASGGMADVWEGLDEVLQRDVAVKIMRGDSDHEEVFLQRFRDEALHSAQLLHVNITTVFDYGEEDGLCYLVMELVDGHSLSIILREAGPFQPSAVRSIIGQSALALGVAHGAGVVHRDVKPANILLRSDGLVKLTDFGIARAEEASGITRHGEMLGTPNYISPEQAMGDPATGASDLYALGVVAHELLTGQRPFDRGTPIATAMSHVNEPPPPLGDDVPEDLRQTVAALLEKKPDDRPENARAVAIMLGMDDTELIGLAQGLAVQVNSEWSADMTPTPRHEIPTMAAQQAAAESTNDQAAGLGEPEPLG